MKILSGFALILRNTTLVTMAVIAGFMLASDIGLPPWLWGVCLIPAGLLFLRLSEGAIPSFRRWFPFFVAWSLLFATATGITGWLRHTCPNIPEGWHTLIFATLAGLSTGMGAIAGWIERLLPRKCAAAAGSDESTPPTGR